MTEPPSSIDTTTPQSPRVWNYWLGGKDNYEVDRQVGDEVTALTPQLPKLARESRRFLVRAVEYLAGEAGIRQFLDVGTGLPTADNTHQVAQRVAPESKIVYVDNDPVVLAHARALLVGTPQGVTKYLDEDLYEPQKIIREAGKILDFNQPVGVMLMGILGHVADWTQAKAVVRALMSDLPSGSYLTTCDSTNVHDPEAMNRAASIYNASANPLIHLRQPWHFTELVTELGLEAVPPGVVPVTQWGVAEEQVVPRPELIDEYGVVARKP
jgi:hypothetical protein